MVCEQFASLTDADHEPDERLREIPVACRDLVPWYSKVALLTVEQLKLTTLTGFLTTFIMLARGLYKPREMVREEYCECCIRKCWLMQNYTRRGY